MDGGSSEESDSNTEQVQAPSSPETKPRSNSAGLEATKQVFSGDPTLAAQFVITYVPILCQAYHSTLSRTVKKMTLDLIRRLLKTPPDDLLHDLSCIELSCGGCLPSILSDLLAISLAPEEYIESHLISLQMIQFSITKCPAIFKDSFTSLGIVDMIKEMVKIPPEQPIVVPDATKIEPRKAYHWNSWCFMAFRDDTVYIWNQFCALELNFMSNGWFKFAIDSKPRLMYSSGTIQPDKRTPSFLHTMKLCRETINFTAGSLPLLSCPDSPDLLMGRWVLSCPEEGVLNISNSQRLKQLLVLREQVADGFGFNYNDNSLNFTGAPMLDLLTITWNRKSKPKSDGSDKIAAIAEKIIEVHFFDSTSIARKSTLKLQALALKLKTACETHEDSSLPDSENHLKEVDELLNNLVTIISSDNSLTAYELHFSKIVDALLACVEPVSYHN
ncbi:E3 ubiquitin-protein ligase HECTD1-like isoform X1 [Oopsacas minuta]|uniref:E3 ubiquitin-protein ligase n=1 Tax=Oopsacas minuta TaxID=111878 RepID=A0AAV7KAA2_9METZ|nr:E3 ubiquitin-protein ligase HECTD1-like isoform X1 [Oopsacas minuta]